jgi:hypothetical protein
VALLAALFSFSPAAAQNSPHILEVREGSSAHATLTLTVRLDGAGPLIVEFGPEEGKVFRLSRASDSLHTVTLGRLKAGRQHHYRVLAGTDTVQGAFKAPPVPQGLQTLVDSMTGRPTSPLVLLEAGKRPGWRGLVALDQDGDVVWYCETAGLVHGAIQRSTGSWVVVDPRVGLREMSPACETLSTLGRTPGRAIHHDVVEAPDGFLLYLAREGREVAGDSIFGDFIRRWKPETGEDEVIWSAFESLDPADDRMAWTRPENWTHANSLHLGPRGNIVLGLAGFNQVASIQSDLSGFEWRMGGPNATHFLGPDDGFGAQHTAAEVSPGRVLLFDNDLRGEREYSRAVEYELADGQAREVWSFRPPRDNWSRVQSSARRLGNGNTLVAFGASRRQSASSGPIEIYEVDPKGEIVWHLVVGDDFQAVYRATPLTTIAGEASLVGGRIHDSRR